MEVRPDREIRMLALRTYRGASYWSMRPVTRLDLAVGAYEEISSADVPGLAEGLLRALPGLIEHRCSIGERGGFLTRLRRGTYAPHIIEHVALELQGMIGHEVGYGRARGTDRPGEYTVVFEHRHAEVGLRAAALALDLVRRAFAGAVEDVEPALAELEALAASPDLAPPRQHVLCGVTGGGPRAEVREEMLRRGVGAEEVIVDLAPAYLLNAGLPYTRSQLAIILDAQPVDVPERYREPERARRLVTVVADAVPKQGLVIVPAHERELQRAVRASGCRVAIFSADGPVTPGDARFAHAAASVQGGRMALECGGDASDLGPVREVPSATAQVVAALALWALTPASPVRGTVPPLPHAGVVRSTRSVKREGDGG